MIEYKNHAVGDRHWRTLELDFQPRRDDFKTSYLKVNGVTFREWSTEFEQAWIMERLTRD